MVNTEWETPQPLFDVLDAEFHFTLDVCADITNAKCSRFYSIPNNSLFKDWSSDICWMNPPYGRGVDVYSWVKKAYNSSQDGGVCMLIAIIH